jgi:hypothetical protein
MVVNQSYHNNYAGASACPTISRKFPDSIEGI